MGAELRIGIVGCDTSHVTAFSDLLHDKNNKYHVAGGRVVAAHPSFSDDVEASHSRVKGFTEQLREKHHVQICDSIGELTGKVDAVLLESVDGRRHLPEFRQIAPAGKPVFIDKPFAAGLKDARQIVQIAREANCPCFSSSALRFDANIEQFLGKHNREEIVGCEAFTPAPLEPTNPGLFWYGIHGVEILYRLMTPGCTSVACVHSEDTDLVVGRWRDGRIGTVRGLRRGQHEYGATVFGQTYIEHVPRSQQVPVYAGLIREIMTFFQTRKPPVSLDETLEMMAFMDAALRSQQQGGTPVGLQL